MTLPLIRARKKPRFGLPWLALLLGTGTVVFGTVGINAVNATATERVEIVIVGEHPWNISQASVDAVMKEPIMTFSSLRMIVTHEFLSVDQLVRGKDLRGEDLGTDVLLSTKISNISTSSTLAHRFTGAGLSADHGSTIDRMNKGFDIEAAFTDNLGLGHGPKAVVAAAERAARILDDGPIQSPIFWLAGTTIGFGLSALTLSLSMSRRRRREQLFRKLSAAQHQLAAVVLDLEALEVTYHATPQHRRTAGFTGTWNAIHQDSLDLARSEDAVLAAVHKRKTSLKPATTAMVQNFAQRAHELEDKAGALLGAGSVLAKLDGGQRVLDQLAAPMTLAAQELLARLAKAIPTSISKKTIKRLRAALNEMLEVLGRDGGKDTSLRDWRNAEFKLQRGAEAVTRALTSSQKTHIETTPGHRADQRSLRTGLGLLATGSEQVLTALDTANAAAQARFGGLDGANVSRRNTAKRPDNKTGEPFHFNGRDAIVWGAALLVFSFPVSTFIVAKISPDPEYRLTGTLPPRSIVIDGELEDLADAGMLRPMKDGFSQEVDVTVAVRSAADYLGLLPGQMPDTYSMISNQDPAVLVDALWRLKEEFPLLVDPSTRELHEDQAIIPVWDVGNGTVVVPTYLSGTVVAGDYGSFGTASWNSSHYHVTDKAAVQVRNVLGDLAHGLENNGLNKGEVNNTLLLVLLTSSIALGLLTLLQIVIYGGSISLRLGRFGRNASTVRQLCDELDALALGLDDSRINAVALLGQGSAANRAESDQRIFERSLALAWRMADELGSWSLSQGLTDEYEARVERLSALVSALSARDGDIERRTRNLLEATRKPSPRQRRS